jgi:hypothetical protein
MSYCFSKFVWLNLKQLVYSAKVKYAVKLPVRRKEMKRVLFIIAIAMVSLAVWGCAPSKVYFAGPPGTKITFEGDKCQYTMPVEVALKKRNAPNTVEFDENGRPIRMILPDGTKLKGYIYVYQIQLDEFEKLAEVTFELTDDQIARLKRGFALDVIGRSAEDRPVYKINLGLDRPSQSQCQ